MADLRTRRSVQFHSFGSKYVLMISYKSKRITDMVFETNSQHFVTTTCDQEMEQFLTDVLPVLKTIYPI